MEQTAAYRLDTHDLVHSFVKNAGMGFAIPYLHNGAHHEYLPDFLVRLADDEERYLILETKGYDPLQDLKTQAALRWVRAVNARRRLRRVALRRDFRDGQGRGRGHASGGMRRFE